MRIKSLIWAVFLLGALAPLTASHAGGGPPPGVDTYILVQGNFIGEQIVTVAGETNVPLNLNTEVGAVGLITLATPGLPGSVDRFNGKIRGVTVRNARVVFDDGALPVAVTTLSAAIMENLRAFLAVRPGGSLNIDETISRLNDGLAFLEFARLAIDDDELNGFLTPEEAEEIRTEIDRCLQLEQSALDLADTRPGNAINLRTRIQNAQKCKRSALRIAVVPLLPFP